ncbi:hypothetical protein NDU88_004651 [Pleurodeles waltl]|uniref:Uncharacterized protein n=1 Tax=Pleurodeles waltl TaxID=8319 RepID=A0AAV7UFT1_PLEWA|nr:hypothetical protein NDU88_004651 [Pleurodeles waltl]
MSSRANEWDTHKAVIRGTCILMAVGIRQTLTLELRQLEQDVRTAERKQAELQRQSSLDYEQNGTRRIGA